jgi:hypothetical protein
LLCERLRATLDLDTPGEDGIPRRVHLEQARVPYEEPPLPAAGEHIWGWFLDLQQADFLTYSELAAWMRIEGIQPLPEEIAALRALFRTRREANNGG